MSSEGLRVAIFGATGHVGAGVVQACLGDGDVTEIRVITRRPIDVDDARVRSFVCEDFADLGDAAEGLDGVDAALYCLGISASKVDGEAQYRVITYDYALTAAKALKARSPNATMHFVSGAGTSTDSWWMWARVKGETEVALRAAGLGGAVCWRPAFVHGGGAAGALFGWWRRGAVHREALGQAMLQALREDRREGTLENRDIRDLADAYRGVAKKKRSVVGRGVLLLLTLLVAVAGFALVDGWTAFGRAPEGSRLERVRASPAWAAEEEKFENTEPLWNDWWGMVSKAFDASDYGSPEAPPPVETIDPRRFERAPASDLRVTWLGHSTLLIEIEGKVFLTDGHRCRGARPTATPSSPPRSLRSDARSAASEPLQPPPQPNCAASVCTPITTLRKGMVPFSSAAPAHTMSGNRCSSRG